MGSPAHRRSLSIHHAAMMRRRHELPPSLFTSSPACEARAAAYRADSLARDLAGKILAQLPRHSLDEPHMRALGAQLIARLDAVITRERGAA